VALEPQPQPHGQLPNTERPGYPHAPSTPTAPHTSRIERMQECAGLDLGRHTRNVGSSTACVPRLHDPTVAARRPNRAGSLERWLGGTRDGRPSSQGDRLHDELWQT
jgi:hypothetical protein